MLSYVCQASTQAGILYHCSRTATYHRWHISYRRFYLLYLLYVSCFNQRHQQVQQNRPHDRPRQFYEFGAFQSQCALLDVWATNATSASLTVTLELLFFDVSSDWAHKEVQEAVLQPNSSTELLTDIKCACQPTTNSSTIVIGARLLSTEGKVLARASDWPQPLKHIVPYVASPGIEVLVGSNEEELLIRALRPVKCLVLSVDDDGVRKEDFTWEQWRGDVGVIWSDNALDVMPGDEQVVRAIGLRGRAVRIAHSGKERARAV
jgi:beta-mannosidase